MIPDSVITGCSKSFLKTIRLFPAALCCLLLHTPFLSAQSSDTELWIGPAIRYTFLKNFRFELEQQLRFNENISAYNFTYLEPGLRYRIGKKMHVQGQYRYSFIPSFTDIDVEEEEYDRQRLTLVFGYRTRLFGTPLGMAYRARFQHTIENTTERKFTYLRNRLELDYRINKQFSPFVSVEPFYRFNQRNVIQKYRYQAGVQVRLAPFLNMESSIHYQPEYHVQNPLNKWVVGMDFKVNLNRLLRSGQAKPAEETEED